MEFQTQEAYWQELESRGKLPLGFRTSTVSFSFLPKERPVKSPLPMKLNLLLLDEPTPSFASVFTRNAFAGSPVIVGREQIQEPFTRGVVINNKIANVGVMSGLEDARKIQKAVSTLLDIQSKEIFPASTGIIGWSLPIQDMVAALPGLVDGLQSRSALPLAKGIMTTDSYPKLRSFTLGGGSIVGIAKGAGMIEPNMATMLVYVMTDLDVPRDELRAMLSRVAENTFNCISVDSDQSTSDMAMVFSSCKVPCPNLDDFEAGLQQVCQELAMDIVRNGEGTAHVLEVLVKGTPSREFAKAVGKAVVNSPLVKTAVFGNDPNVGRLVSSVGDYLGNQGLSLDRSTFRIDIGPYTVFKKGGFCIDMEKEELLFRYFKQAAQPEKKEGYPRHERNVKIFIDFGTGEAQATVLGSDLSYEYVRENADYRS